MVIKNPLENMEIKHMLIEIIVPMIRQVVHWIQQKPGVLNSKVNDVMP